MNLLLAIISCLCALVPAVVFLRNLHVYRPLPRHHGKPARCSVLIPARNEESTIADALWSVLKSVDVELEVIVLDDNSTDRTAEVARRLAAVDGRVRVVEGKALPPGWTGKNFACQQLAELAHHPLLVFLDADVKITRPDALARLAEFVRQSGAALVSTVPFEETRTPAEKLIIPLIHFILLGFLPLRRMRLTTDPRFAAACGQVVAVRREAYLRSGGHGASAGRLHDAIALARAFRCHGYATDLFDGTDSFACRMYSGASAVWRGFARNATEGLGAPGLILPSTLLLLGGQVLPLWLLCSPGSRLTLAFATLATLAAFLPRVIAVFRFRQSILGALLHPLGIVGLLAIQWFAFLRALAGHGADWKGRAYLTQDLIPSPNA